MQVWEIEFRLLVTVSKFIIKRLLLLLSLPGPSWPVYFILASFILASNCLNHDFPD